jgi:hypothetical protein
MFVVFPVAIMVLSENMPRTWIRHDVDFDLAVVAFAAFISLACELVISIFVSSSLNATSDDRPAPKRPPRKP